MTQSEYQQLVEFLGGQFTAIDRRFAEMDRRFTMRFDAIDERFREVFGHFDRIQELEQRLRG